jgi:hypothetical protein
MLLANGMTAFLIIGGIVAVVVAALAIGVWYERKRTLLLAQQAQEMGLTFTPDQALGLQQELGDFGLFKSGHSRKVKNVISGETDEVRLVLFDYQYTTGSGKQSHTHKQTVALIDSPRLALPSFSLRPETMFDRIGGLLGFKDIDFDTHPEFSRRFVLKSPQEEAVRKTFNPNVLRFMETQSAISIEGQGTRLVYYRPGKRSHPTQLREMMQKIYEFYGAFVDSSP